MSSTGPTAAPVRIGPNPLRAMALPISQAQPLTVSVTPTSHISLPQQQNLLIGKQPLRFPTTAATAAAAGGKILQMPIVAAASQQSGAGQPSGVTIQKTTIPGTNDIHRVRTIKMSPKGGGMGGGVLCKFKYA